MKFSVRVRGEWLQVADKTGNARRRVCFAMCLFRHTKKFVAANSPVRLTIFHDREGDGELAGGRGREEVRETRAVNLFERQRRERRGRRR